MFDGLKAPRDITKYTLMRGVTDFGNLNQYNLFETGYPYLIIVSTPRFMDKLADKYTEIGNLWRAFLHILEYEFRGLDGIENITSDASELTNNISTLNVITKVNEQSASTFTAQYFEKSGSTLTKVAKIYLTGIKDPRTQLKHYHGLIEDGTLEAGYENEVFSFLYFVTDNTGLELEQAYYIMDAQLTEAETSMYAQTKGEIGFREITLNFSGFPVSNDLVTSKCKQVLDYINDPTRNSNAIVKSSLNFNYTGISNIDKYAK